MRHELYDISGALLSVKIIPATKDEVTAERDRRIDEPFVFNGVSYQVRAQDRENIMGAALLANMALAQGQPFAIDWIAEDNSVVSFDALGMISFAKAAAERKSQLIFAARALKDRIEAGEIIEDCSDPSYWP